MPRVTKGFTLIEGLIVMVILAMMFFILIPKVWIYRNNALKIVFATNRETVFRKYNTVNIENNSAIEFDQFIYENFELICPNHGRISYAEGKILCSIHDQISDEDEEQDNEVHWLSNNRLILIMNII